MISPKDFITRVTGVSLILALVGMLCAFFMQSCKSPRERQRQPEQKDRTEELIRNQQMIVKDESDEIDNYISRTKYQMTATATGLRYFIYSKGPGLKPVIDDTPVLINYSVSLLDGTTVYNSDSTGTLEIKVGKSEVASGLQEGLKLMKEGDKAIFIIPSHLAYGLSGDGDKIKQYQVLVVDVKSLKVLN